MILCEIQSLVEAREIRSIHVEEYQQCMCDTLLVLLDVYRSDFYNSVKLNNEIWS